MKIGDIVIVLLTIVIIYIALMLFTGCATTCKKLCCPEEGHGPCPICTDPL